MGAMADAIARYAEPLLKQTDGSVEQLNKAFSITQLCYNLALLPAESRAEMLGTIRSSFQMDKEEFDEFERSIIDPMIQRHHEMFPLMHLRHSTTLLEDLEPSLESQAEPAKSREAAPRIDRYAPCPCNSGEKYKFCCGKTRR